jgi:hypothetical protein
MSFNVANDVLARLRILLLYQMRSLLVSEHNLVGSSTDNIEREVCYLPDAAAALAHQYAKEVLLDRSTASAVLALSDKGYANKAAPIPWTR